MQKIRIRLPATLTDIGPALGNLGLALSLYTHVEISPRSDERLIVDTEGEGAGQYAIGLRHPVVLAMIRLFQRLERAPLGIHVRINNQIPLNSGLGAEAAFMVAGVIGANNLMGNVFRREQLIEFAAVDSGQPDHAVAAVVGGLTTSMVDEDNKLWYRAIEPARLHLIIAVPQVPDYGRPVLPERLPTAAALRNLSRLPLLVEALRAGDLALLARVTQDELLAPHIQEHIPGFSHVAEIARLAGAVHVTTTGGGPAIVFFAPRDHDRIAEVIETAFANLDIPARVLVAPLDTQGIVLSMLQST